eukprot:CAMPEP_0172453622 /NCGR_PEP_ID=MMETSP1065-20121228/10852_1 /TAXON_ID=265537 /ORGANISM="Amphiprora paludosa, Strain CCMP125" /LENGTH=355 /DNA_ID=CAMNT_0013205807 /DNA_START=61 /DNA_END=1128 /DNA_ORIENTATION=-
MTDEAHLYGEFGEEDDGARKGKHNKRRDTLRKAPQAPKRFKSSYICFFMAKQPEIKQILGEKATISEISKKSAEMWKNLPADERAYWDDVAAKDKERYMVEKASYTGPWQVPWKRAKKDPSAPKRPMSAFLYYSQGKRSHLKKQHPDMKNTEVSRLLGEMWRNSSDQEKRPHIEKEREERSKYKIRIAEWRKESEEKQRAQRKAQAEWAASSEQQQQAAAAAQQQHQQQQHQMAAQQGMPYGAPSDPYSMHSGSPYMYHHQHHMAPPPQAPYGYPPNQGGGGYNYGPGKAPVILGPNGVPHYAASAPADFLPPYGTEDDNTGLDHIHHQPPPQQQHQHQQLHSPGDYPDPVDALE